MLLFRCDYGFMVDMSIIELGKLLYYQGKGKEFKYSPAYC